MKAYLCIFLSLLAVAQSRSLLASEDGPDSPPYEIINSTRSLEIREYENATWAVAFGRSRWSIDFAARSAGLELVRYFKGGNVAHTFIQPTVPLVATVLRPPPPPHHKNGSHPHHGNGSHPEPPPHRNGSHPKPPHHKPRPPPGPPAVALAAYIPGKYEGKAPIPDSPHVKILHTNSTKAYAHKFGGWAISWVVKHEIKHLVLALKNVDICPGKGKFFVATYSGPFQIFGRRNEVLWVKRPKHHHHNDTLPESDPASSLSSPVMGLEALDVEALFPEEFPPVPDLEQDQDQLKFSQGEDAAEEDAEQVMTGKAGSTLEEAVQDLSVQTW